MSRIERVAKLIKKVISEVIREDVSDPRIGFISITEVDISPDLEDAKIFVSILGTEEQKKEGMQGLVSATRFIRGKLGPELPLREVPRISFVLDNSLEKGSRVLEILSRERSTSHHKKSA